MDTSNEQSTLLHKNIIINMVSGFFYFPPTNQHKERYFSMTSNKCGTSAVVLSHLLVIL